MEGGRLILAIALMIAVVVITNILFPPAPRPDPVVAPAEAVPARTDTVPDVPAESVARTIPAPTPALDETDPGLPEDTVVVESELFRLGLSTRGGAVVSAQLLLYESYAPGSEGRPVELVPSHAASLLGHKLQIGERVLDLATLPFRADRERLDLSSSADRDLVLSYRDSASDAGFDITYTFDPTRYALNVSIRTVGLGDAKPQLLLDMGPRLGLNEAGREEDERSLAYVVNGPSSGIISTSPQSVRDQRVTNGPLSWIALKSKYFLAAAMQAPNGMPFGGVIALPGEEEFDVQLSATLLSNASGELGYQLYLGPQDFERLAAFNNRLQDVSVFGWKFLQPVLRPLGHAITWALLQMHRVLGFGYGWVLILFGFLVRLVLWPLNAKAMRAQMKNMEMQPRIKEIQARYKTEPEKLQKEMLRLYKEEGFNPMGGCLPMLLPLPVLITLFFVFQGTIEFRGVEFLWLPDLSRADPLYILPVALGLSMFVQQWLNTRTSQNVPPQMKYMTYIMPVFLTILFLNFASGLNLYYASMNVASVPQQLQIMKERKKRLAERT